MAESMHIVNPCRLTSSPERHWSRYPAVILDREGNYCVSWYNYPPPDSAIPCSIYFCKGSDRLDSVGAREPIRVTDDERNHSGGTLCQDEGGDYHLVWHCRPQHSKIRSLLYSRSPDGISWSRPIQPVAQFNEYMVYPSLIWHPARGFFLTFFAKLGAESRVYITSSENGMAWKAPFMLPTCTQGDNKSALAVTQSGELIVVWRHLKGETHGLRWSSSDDGQRWHKPEAIAVACRDVDRPKLSSDNAGRIWLSYEGDGLIWVCRLDHDRGWSQPINLQTGAAVESRPSALIQNQQGEYWIAWTSQRNGTEVWAGRVLLD
ncbi:MAG: exo-alpha-sialidase [Rhodocyclaceae bacterium]|nr:exo-alpha-sialidase [Rhodocyclaceae bacterium]